LGCNRPYWLSLAILVGLVVGSFFNVVILRLPRMMIRDWRHEAKACLEAYGDADVDDNISLAFPNSHCPTCKAPIKAWQNIPVISYLWLKGKCGQCQAPISIRYPIVELVTAVLTGLTLWVVGLTPLGFALVLMTWVLIILTVIDLDHQLLPDQLTLPLLWLGLGFNLYQGHVPLDEAVLGAMAGYLSLWSVYWLFKLVTGKEGMGYGDFKLLAALGAWLGWKMLPVVILMSSLVGAIVGLSLIAVLGRDRNVPIPFGPYLAAAGWIAALWGQDLMDTYFAFAVSPL
jgi:leader peptidase (prepilin peptidase)/N-methyltransferase